MCISFVPCLQRVTAPAMEMNSRRAALFGLAALSVPKAAEASAIWVVNKDGLGAPKPSTVKCNVEKPCTAGAGLKWDPAALGVKAAEKRKCATPWSAFKFAHRIPPPPSRPSLSMLANSYYRMLPVLCLQS